ncbi:MAG: helix-turn-helix transcriptional regulator [Pseudomonadota bacterium]
MTFLTQLALLRYTRTNLVFCDLSVCFFLAMPTSKGSLPVPTNKSEGVNALANQTSDHADIFAALDRAYGLIDGSATWSDCLEALSELAGLEASRLLLYDCGRGESHIVEATDGGFEKGRPIRNADIDEALWQSTPGEIWQPPMQAVWHNADLSLCGCSVLDRDSLHILYLEFLKRRSATELSANSKYLLQTVLPHLHRACRLHRSITGEDLIAFATPDVEQPAKTTGLPVELRLRRRFRLSKAEARVATLLSDGLAPRMIADRLNVSIHTVRSQLQAIFNKTDTSRQAELTSLILRETEIPRAICHAGTVGMKSSEQPPCP